MYIENNRDWMKDDNVYCCVVHSNRYAMEREQEKRQPEFEANEEFNDEFDSKF